MMISAPPRRPMLKRVRARGRSQGTVVLVHGTLDSCSSFGKVAEALPLYDVVSFDRRGWGSSRALGGVSIDMATHVDDLLSLINETDNTILAGHSYGALIALAAADRAPDRVRRLVAFEPAVRWLPWWPLEAPWERLVRERADDPVAAASELINAVAGFPVASRRAAPELAADGAALIVEMLDPSLQLPCFDPLTMPVSTVVAAGQRSLPHHVEVSRRLAELLPRGRYVEITGCGHGVHLSHPRQFADLIATLDESYLR